MKKKIRKTAEISNRTLESLIIVFVIASIIVIGGAVSIISPGEPGDSKQTSEHYFSALTEQPENSGEISPDSKKNNVEPDKAPVSNNFGYITSYLFVPNTNTFGGRQYSLSQNHNFDGSLNKFQYEQSGSSTTARISSSLSLRFTLVGAKPSGTS